MGKANRRHWILILSCIAILSFWLTQHYIGTKSLEGVFVTNYSRTMSIVAEMPNSTDTLTILADGTFRSCFYGAGTYEVRRDLVSTFVILRVSYDFGQGSIILPAKRTILGEISLILNSDSQLFYLKQR